MSELLDTTTTTGVVSDSKLYVVGKSRSAWNSFAHQIHKWFCVCYDLELGKWNCTTPFVWDLNNFSGTRCHPVSHNGLLLVLYTNGDENNVWF